LKEHFPNPIRSYDPDSSRILFWGYDKAMEFSFYLETAALKRLYPEMSNVEPEFLKAFDTARERICEVANKVSAWCRWQRHLCLRLD